jgi:hypothetical protein
MKSVMVRYRVKPDRAAENEKRISSVFEQLAREQHAGLRYAVFKLDDGVSFVHVASDEATNGRSTLGELSAFKEFTAGIADRCEEQPVVTQLTIVGAYTGARDES